MRLPFLLARRFVAGESFQEALPVIRALNRKGLSVTLDLLGEHVTRQKVAETSRDAYIRLVRIIAKERDRRAMQAGISIKLSMIGQKIDEDYCLKNLRMLLEAAKECNVFVRLDMEGSDATASTISLFEETFPEYPDHVGIVLQAYLKRTERDVERMCALKAPVRLCKGAYKEPSEIAWQNMDIIREHFMACAQELIAHGRYPRHRYTRRQADFRHENLCRESRHRPGPVRIPDALRHTPANPGTDRKPGIRHESLRTLRYAMGAVFRPAAARTERKRVVRAAESCPHIAMRKRRSALARFAGPDQRTRSRCPDLSASDLNPFRDLICSTPTPYFREMIQRFSPRITV